MPKQGEFIWHDLATSDLEGAVAFYVDTIGWTAAPMAGVPMEIHSFTAGDAMVGAAMALTDDMKAEGAPSSWTPCMASEDLDALCDKVKALGGAVINPPDEVPGGRFALLQDPQGAMFEAYQAEDKNGEAEQAESSAPGHFSWYDLNTTDWEAARAFYGELFGWTESGMMPDSPAGPYWMFKSQSGDRSLGGMSAMAAKMGVPPHWLCYVTVDDLDRALERVQSQGGTVVNGPMEVPGGDRIVHCMDPQGAAFALHAAPAG